MKYKASVGTGRIEPVEILKETPAHFTYLDHGRAIRVRKDSKFERFFDSQEDAVAFLLSIYEGRVQLFRQVLLSLEEKINRLVSEEMERKNEK